MVRTLHRLAGIVMLLPFLGWAVTGIVFFTKPGYGAAYDSLPIKAYPIEEPIAVRADPAWREVRYLRTILGPQAPVQLSVHSATLLASTERAADHPACQARCGRAMRDARLCEGSARWHT